MSERFSVLVTKTFDHGSGGAAIHMHELKDIPSYSAANRICEAAEKFPPHRVEVSTLIIDRGE